MLTLLLAAQLHAVAIAACPDGAIRACTLAGCCRAVQECVFPTWGACTCESPRGAPCDDGNACTSNDRLDTACRCAGTPVTIDDGNPCTGDFCDPALGVRHVPVAVDDGNPCTADSCSPTTGSIAHTPLTGAACGTSGTHWCDSSGQCLSAPVTHLCLDDAGNITRQVTCAAGTSCTPTCP